MKLNVLFSAQPKRWQQYRLSLAQAFVEVGLSVDMRTEFEPEAVDFMVYAPNREITDFLPFSRLKAVLGLWAGVEDIVDNPTLNAPLTRMVDNGLAEGMAEWVTGHVLRHHLGMDVHITQKTKVWKPIVPPLARERRIGILGLGVLGLACGQALSHLNFNVAGWSRNPKKIDGIRCLSGNAGLAELLATSEIIILLLPLTKSTENILNSETIAQMSTGSIILNPGRGALIDDAALLRALDSGHIAHATLDVFRIEPLPTSDRYWEHPSVTVTPHIASETRAISASAIIAENIRRFEAGEPMQFIVDRVAGY